MPYYKNISDKKSGNPSYLSELDIFGTRLEKILSKPHLSPEYTDGDMGALILRSEITARPAKTLTFTAPEDLTIRKLLFFTYSNALVVLKNIVFTNLNDIVISRIEVVSGTGPDVGLNIIDGSPGGIRANFFNLRSLDTTPELNIRANAGDVIEVEIAYGSIPMSTLITTFVNCIFTYDPLIDNDVSSPTVILGIQTPIPELNESSLFPLNIFNSFASTTETLPPTQVLYPNGSSNLTGGLAEVITDPSAPDGTWISINNPDIIAHAGPLNAQYTIGFGGVEGILNDGVGLQTFRLLIRKVPDAGNPPFYAVDLLEFGEVVEVLAPYTQLGVLGNSFPGLVLTYTWNSSVLQDKSGNNATVRFSVWRSLGSPGGRRTVQLGGIAWDADYRTTVLPSFTRATATLTVDSAPASGPIHLAPTNFLSFLGFQGDIGERIKTLSSIPGGDADNYNSSIAVVQDLRDDILNVLSVTGSSDFDSFLEIEAAGTNQILFTSKFLGQAGNFNFLSSPESNFAITEFTGGTSSDMTATVSSPSVTTRLLGVYVNNFFRNFSIVDPSLISFHGTEISDILINSASVGIGNFVIDPMVGVISFKSVDVIVTPTDIIQLVIKAGGGFPGEFASRLDIMLVGIPV